MCIVSVNVHSLWRLHAALAAGRSFAHFFGMNWTKRWREGIGAGLVLLGATASVAQEQQRKDLELMRILNPTQVPRGRINAVDATWEAWQKRTGELPPDFQAMRSQPFLPDPLEGVRTREDWPARRVELKKQIEQCRLVYGP